MVRGRGDIFFVTKPGKFSKISLAISSIISPKKVLIFFSRPRILFDLGGTVAGMVAIFDWGDKLVNNVLSGGGQKNVLHGGIPLPPLLRFNCGICGFNS